MIDKITVNTQSSIRIEGEKVIYFDPYKIEEEKHDADIVFITHDHYDHYEVESIKKVMNDKTTIIIPDSMAPQVLGVFLSKNIVGVVANDEYEVGGVKFKTVPSYNIDKQFHPKSKGFVGYIVNILDKEIYVAGDTDITDENKQVECDIAMVPIGGTYTMTPEEAAELVNIIKPEYVIPTHYGSIVGELKDAEKFRELLDAEIISVEKLER